MTRCHIALGGNSGPVAENFAAALDRLNRSGGCSVVAVSRSHETSPVGEQAGGRFLNAAAELETALAPLALLDLLQSIESDLGRVRSVRWGPRPIDLDLLFYGSDVLYSPRLVVPHPAAWYRRFVLDPLVEIASDLTHPVKHMTMQALRQRLLVRPLQVALTGGDATIKSDCIAVLRSTFADAEFADADVLDARLREPTFIFWLGRSEAAFEQLPLLPRIDASSVTESPFEFVRDVLRSALCPRSCLVQGFQTGL